jgi:hypothetical protein
MDWGSFFLGATFGMLFGAHFIGRRLEDAAERLRVAANAYRDAVEDCLDGEDGPDDPNEPDDRKPPQPSRHLKLVSRKVA